MAGELEEPFGINLRADSFNSGSISFGRFEKEDLSWERRSSFSHNRYLEEVEKYSKPGSVVEKKAYFEAHFKKKGILRPGAFGDPNGREYPNGKIDTLENEDHEEEYGELTEIGNDACFHEVVPAKDGEFHNEDGVQFLNSSDGNRSVQYDKSSAGSEYKGEGEVIENGKEDSVSYPSESQVEASLQNGNELVEVLEDDQPVEAHHSKSDESCLSNDRQEMETKGHLSDNDVNVNKLSSPIVLSSNHGTERAKGEQMSALCQRNLAPKTRAATERTPSKSRLKSHVTENQTCRSMNSGAAKVAGKSQNCRVKESLRGTKLEKQSPEIAVPTKSSLLRTPKKEDMGKHASRLTTGNRSEKELSLKKDAVSQLSGSMEIRTRVHQSGNRLKQNVGSIKPGSKPNPPAFNFKSGERAERRKGFYTKLEEKFHAKEAELNHIQARTQEKTAAEIKKFRQSLNFKATPMPSFYHKAVQKGTSGNKAVFSKLSPAKAQQKTTSPGHRAAKSQLLPTAENESLSARESVNTTDWPDLSTTSECPEPCPCETPLTNNDGSPEVTRKNGPGSKMESQKVTDCNMDCDRVSRDSNLPGIQTAEGKDKRTTQRNSSKIINKSTNGIVSSSGMGHRIIGVAS